ncbi:hypothetical protein WEH80_38395 [Actinomycetes bacterium KLBMP 9759]
MPSRCAQTTGLRSRSDIRAGRSLSALPTACCSVWRMVACRAGDSSAMLKAITIEITSDSAPMITNWDCHVPKYASVAPAMAAERKFAPTGPHVQNPNAVARPMRGEKSRTSGAVAATAIPSTNDSTIRVASSCAGESTSVIAKHNREVSSMVGTSSRTRPTLSVQRPAMMPATAPESADAAEIAP